MNFLVDQVANNGGRLPDGPHFVHCYIYEGHHCSCGGNYTGDRSGPDVTDSEVAASIIAAADKS